MSENIRNKVLIIFAHPALQKSRINAELIKAVNELEGVTFRDLYDLYPDFHIDVKKEQELLIEHDVIVFQHPFYWYSAPAIIKEWEDLVLEFGFAYGHEGTALKGKMMMNVLTAGGSFGSYDRYGIHKYRLTEFLKPFEQSAVLCGMHYIPPFVVHDASVLKKYQDIAVYKDLYGEIIKTLRDEEIDLKELQEFEYINDYFLEKYKSRSL